MRRFITALAVVSAGLIVTGCSISRFMELNECNCFVLQRGITQEQFLGPDARTHSWLGPSEKPKPKSTRTFRLGDDVWDVWVYGFDSDYLSTGGDWASQAQENIEFNSITESGHQEYVAFRNGHLEDWGYGSRPRALKDIPAVEIQIP